MKKETADLVDLQESFEMAGTSRQFEIDYYKERFESGTTDWNTTLVFFAESPENVSLVAPQIEDGIWMPF